MIDFDTFQVQISKRINTIERQIRELFLRLNNASNISYFDSSTGKMSRGGAQQLDVLGIDCYTESGTHIFSAATISATGLALSASTWYHVYVYLSASVVTLEVTTTAPAAPYKGTARSKTGDTSRRYVGSVYASGVNTLGYFSHNPQTGKISVLENTNGAPFLLVSNGSATIETNVSTITPITAVGISLFVSSGNATYRIALGNSEDNAALANTVGVFLINPLAQASVDMPLDVNQQFNYLVGGAGGQAYIFETGYYYGR